jgi:hypothetical protein
MNETEITLTLLTQEAMAVVNLVGQLPTSANAYPLFMKLKAQIDSQMPKQDAVPTE